MNDNFARSLETENDESSKESQVQFRQKSSSPSSDIDRIFDCFGKLASAIVNAFCRLCKRICIAPKLAAAVLIALVLIGGSCAITSAVVRTSVASKTTSFGLKNIGELATQSGFYTNVQVIKKSQEIWGAQIPFTQSKYIFSYDGQIKAGLDFGDVDVKVDALAKTVRVTLPEIRILSTEIDENSLEIYDESKNIFTPLSLDDVNESLIELKEEAQQTAIDNGLLEQARTNAELLISGFLAGSYDAQEYSIVFL